MRHLKDGKKLNRDINERKALFKNLIQSLILKEEIRTTEAKAKAIKGLVDKLIYRARSGTLHVRRQIMAFLPDKKAANKLVDDIAKRFTDRVGGFTKMARMGWQRGSHAPLVKMELAKKAEKAAKPAAAEKTVKPPKSSKPPKLLK